MMNTYAAVQTQTATKPTFTPVTNGVLQCACACGKHSDSGSECEECKKRREAGMLQLTSINPSSVREVPPIVHEVLHLPGQPLDAQTRTFTEPLFGHDFSSVRVHADARAAESVRAMNALAYTVGQDIFFGANQYQPYSAEGNRLIAHELTHVIQQKGAPGLVRPNLSLGQPADAYEQEADCIAGLVSRPANLHSAGKDRNSFHSANTRISNIHRVGDSSIVQRSLLGGLIGGTIGSILGGIGGFLIGGVGGAIVGAGLGAAVGALIGHALSGPVNPLSDMSTFQSPGASGWWGAKFGCYRNNCTRKHKGWDIHALAGTAIWAVHAGSMTHHEDPGGYGHYAKLKSKAEPTREFIYAHLSNREPAGDYHAGAKLGQTGTTGNASPNRPHLHFEIQTNGVAEDPSGMFTEPSQVIEATGSPVTKINKSDPAPCAACGM